MLNYITYITYLNILKNNACSSIEFGVNKQIINEIINTINDSFQNDLSFKINKTNEINDK
jgi:hypothetical protein